MMKNLPAYFQQQQQNSKMNKLFSVQSNQQEDESQNYQNMDISPSRVSMKKKSNDDVMHQKRESVNTLNKNENIKVVVRIRPPLMRELNDQNNFVSTIQVSPDSKRLMIYEYNNIDFVDPQDLQDYLDNPNNYNSTQFAFDQIYDQETRQEEVYQTTAQPAVLSVLQGFNATVMAYGQTGTGKTYTMEGFIYNSKDQGRGIVPRCTEQIFKYIEDKNNNQTTFMVRVSYLQIYKDIISDLLSDEKQGLVIRENKKRGIFVEGLSDWTVRTPGEIFKLIEKGAVNRATAETKLNDISSRSHAIFMIIVEQMQYYNKDGQQRKTIKVGKLNLVDLAGSERIRVTGATGMRLEESKKINQSLSALGQVIKSLSDKKESREHIPYRNSKLTRILEDSLGGNCKTTFMAMISPSIDSYNETINTLRFSSRVKKIKNIPVINQDNDQKTLLRKYEIELQKLREQLQERNQNILDLNKVSQLEQEKRQAEQDKFAAMAALESRSREFFIEREEKRKLEERIRNMDSQLLIGGRKIEDTPQFRNAIQQQQKLIREEYQDRLNELEKEREQIEEDKAQVDRYKQLLLKQRDIMIALTSRLNERDETIIQLQEELDAYDRIHKETEDQLESSNQRIKELESYFKNNENMQQYNNAGYNQQQQQLIQDQKEQIQRLNQMVQSQNSKGGVNINAQQFQQQIQELEQEKNSLEEVLKEYHSKQQQMEEYIQYKENEIQGLMQNQMQGGYQQSEKVMQDVKSMLKIQLNILQQVDEIIDILSRQPNDQFKLQNVAKQLLNLQKYVRNSIQH